MEGSYDKKTHISAVALPRTQNLVSNVSIELIRLPDCRLFELSNLHIMSFNENIRNEYKNHKKNQGTYLQNYSYLSCLLLYSTKIDIKVFL